MVLFSLTATGGGSGMSGSKFLRLIAEAVVSLDETISAFIRRHEIFNGACVATTLAAWTGSIGAAVRCL